MIKVSYIVALVLLCIVIGLSCAKRDLTEVGESEVAKLSAELSDLLVLVEKLEASRGEALSRVRELEFVAGDLNGQLTQIISERDQLRVSNDGLLRYAKVLQEIGALVPKEFK